MIEKIIALSYGLQTVLLLLQNPEKMNKLPGIKNPYDTTSCITYQTNGHWRALSMHISPFYFVRKYY